MSKKLYVLNLFLFSAIVACAVYKFVALDWSQQPGRAELERAANSFVPSDDFKLVTTRRVQKLTLIGQSFTRRGKIDFREAARQYEQFALASGFYVRENLGGGGRYRKIFCRQAVAMDVEINDIGEGAVVTGGAYWSASRGGLYYCRSGSNGANRMH